MNPSQLKVGDQVRIKDFPQQENGFIHKETIAAYRKLVRRGRPVRIAFIDEDGIPWFNFRLKKRNGKWEHHSMGIFEEDKNWVTVKNKN